MHVDGQPERRVAVHMGLRAGFRVRQHGERRELAGGLPSARTPTVAPELLYFTFSSTNSGCITVVDETVHDRIDSARASLTPGQIAAGLAIAASIGFTLLFLQEPLAHDAMHNFRHGAGITCH